MILYFGYQHSEHSIATLYGKKLAEFDKIIIASDYKSQIVRMLHMVLVFMKHVNEVKLIFIETYSTRAFYCSLVLASLSKLFSVQYIPVLHGGNLVTRLDNSRLLSKFVFHNSYRTVTPSMFLQEQFRLNGFDVEYIPNFIELEKYQFKHRKKCSPKLLWVRAFHKIYNPEMAIKTLAKLSTYYQDAELCMVGPEKDGSMKSCRVLADEMGVLDKVTFTGMLPKTEWIELSQNYDIFINTTNLESFGVSVIEAAACGLPIVTTNVGELIYLYKDGEDALLVEKDDAHNMVKKITSIIEDKILAENLSKQARKKAEGFEWETVKLQWDNLITTL